MLGLYIGRMENNMETTIVYWGYIGGYTGVYRVSGFPKIGVPFLGVPIIRTIVYWGLYWGSLI